MDEVLTYDWAYGNKSGFKMENKKIALAITAGVNEIEFCPTGKYKYNMAHLLSPFELTFEYVKAEYKGFFAYYGVNRHCSEEELDKSVPLYLEFLDTL